MVNAREHQQAVLVGISPARWPHFCADQAQLRLELGFLPKQGAKSTLRSRWLLEGDSACSLSPANWGDSGAHARIGLFRA